MTWMTGAHFLHSCVASKGNPLTRLWCARYNAPMHDLIIVGGGPAGAAAAVYAARKQLRTLLITHEWGGQSTVSGDIQNWIGTPSISGTELAASLKKHVESYQGDFFAILASVHAASIETNDCVRVTDAAGMVHEAAALLIATGANRKKLDIPGAQKFDQKGLTYCASCDGPLFTGQDVVVIGGGNAGFETAAQLLAYTKSVTLLDRGAHFKADEITVQKVIAHPHMKAFNNAEPLEVLGEKFVSGLAWKNTVTGEESRLPVTGIFVEIGLVPNTAWTGTVVEKNHLGQVVVEPRTQKTSHPRIWAAGDCTDSLYHQNNIAAGDAVRALEDIYKTLKTT